MPLAHRSIETLPHQSNPRWVQPWQGHPHPSARERPPLLGSSSQSIDMGQKIAVKRYNNRPPDQASLLAFFECFSRLTPLVNTNCAFRLTPRAIVWGCFNPLCVCHSLPFQLGLFSTRKSFCSTLHTWRTSYLRIIVKIFFAAPSPFPAPIYRVDNQPSTLLHLRVGFTSGNISAKECSRA